MKITFDEPNDELFNNKQILIKPLLSEDSFEFSTSMVFKGLDILNLSEFYIITVRNSDDEFSGVIKIPTTGMPEGRQGKCGKREWQCETERWNGVSTCEIQ